MAGNGSDRTKRVWTEEELDALTPEELASFTQEERDAIVNGGVEIGRKKKGYAILTVLEIVGIIAIIAFVIILILTK